MATDPVTLPSTTDSIGTTGMTHLYTGIRRRHWWHFFDISADFTVDEDTEALAVDGDGTGGVTITLEDASTVGGKGIIIYSSVLATGNTITISPGPTGDTVDSAGSLTITAQDKFVHLISDGGTNWILYIDGR